MEANMFAKLKSYLRMAAAYVKLNVKSQLEYRGAFITQALAMFINDSFWVLFWVLFFNRFPVLQGWEIKDVITIWAVAASGFGIAALSASPGLSRGARQNVCHRHR
jgi:ABC-2 type transport system permease protein